MYVMKCFTFIFFVHFVNKARLVEAHLNVVHFAAFISPLCLPLDSYAASDKNSNEKTGIVAGWGVSTFGLFNIEYIFRKSISDNDMILYNFNISDNSAVNPMLQYLQLPIVDTRSCADSYARFSANSRTPIIINENQICAQGTANRDACQGVYT